MRTRSQIALTVSILLAAACSGSDPGALGLGGGGHAGGGGTAGASQQNDGGDSASHDAGGGAATGNDAGASTGGGDAGTASHDAAPPPSNNAFTGAGAYASAPPGSQAQDFHGFSLAGKSCYDCHGANPSSGIHFTIAGRVFADAAGQTPAADVEVRAVDHNGAASSAHSDNAGYFWVKGGTLTLPALAGARNAQSTALMVGALSDPAKGGGCNGCHNGATTAYLHVP